MAVHAGQLSGPIRPSSRRVSQRGLRIRRFAVRSAVLAAVAISVFAIATSPRLAHAAHEVCTAGQPAGTSCGVAIYELGYPE